MGLQFRLSENAVDYRLFDAVEVSPCADHHGNVEVCSEAEADFWLVYGHFKEGHVECLSDWTTKKEAIAEGVRVLDVIKRMNGGVVAVGYVQIITY